MRRKYYDPCSDCYLIVNLTKRQFIRCGIFGTGCDTNPLISWEGIAFGLLTCVPPALPDPIAGVGAWAGDSIIVLYAGIEWQEQGCEHSYGYQTVVETFDEISVDVLVMMTAVHPAWAQQLACKADSWQFSSRREFAYFTLLTRSPLLWSALDACVGTDWPIQFATIIKDSSWVAYQDVLTMNLQSPLPLEIASSDNPILVNSPLALAVNLTRRQYLDLQRLRLYYYYPDQPTTGLGAVGEAVSSLIQPERTMRHRHMTGAWLFDHIALVYRDSKPDGSNILTTTEQQPQRNLYEFARENYLDITDEFLLSLLLEDEITAEEYIATSRENSALLVDIGNLIFRYPGKTSALKMMMERELGAGWTARYKAAQS